MRDLDQPTLFDAAAAEAAKIAAITKVERNADPAWKVEMLGAVAAVARRMHKFTSDDVWEELHGSSDADTHEPRALGAIMKKAATAGIIVATSEYRPSCRVACHARPVRVWRSLVCEAQGL
jgi:hypothetical protein